MKKAKNQATFALEDTQAMVVFTAEGQVALVCVPNQYDPGRDRAHNARLIQKVLNGQEVTTEDLEEKG